MLKRQKVSSMLSNNILRNSFYITLARFSAYFLTFIFTALNARYLGAGDYGRLTYIITVMTILSVFFTMGMDVYVVIQVSKNRDMLNRCLTANIVNRTVLVLLSTTVLFMLNLMVPIISIDIAVLLIFMSFVLDGYRTVAVGCYQAMERMGYIAAFDILKLVVLNICFVFLRFTDLGLMSAAAAYFTSSLIALVFSFRVMYRKFGFRMESVGLDELKTLMVCSFPFFLNAIVMIATSRVDLVMINQMMGDTQTGYYYGAKRIYELMLMVPGILTTVLLPKLSSGEIERRKITIAARGLFGIGVAAAISVFFLSRLAILIVLGPKFVEAYRTLQIFALGLPIVFLNFLYGTMLAAANKRKQLVIINVTGAALNIILNYKVIPVYHANGAAVVGVCVSLVSLLLNSISQSKINFEKKAVIPVKA